MEAALEVAFPHWKGCVPHKGPTRWETQEKNRHTQAVWLNMCFWLCRRQTAPDQVESKPLKGPLENLRRFRSGKV